MRIAIHSELAPAEIGAYSQAIKCGDIVYLSGQIGLDPQTMRLCSTDIDLQIDQVIKNLSLLCIATDANLNHIVKLSVYLIDLSHAALVNHAIERHFSKPYPARVMIGVAGLPCGALVEMDAVLSINSL